MARAASRRWMFEAADLTPLWSGPETLSVGWWNFGLSIASDGMTSAIMRESFSSPPELWAGPIGAWKPIPVFAPADASGMGKVGERPLAE